MMGGTRNTQQQRFQQSSSTKLTLTKPPQEVTGLFFMAFVCPTPLSFCLIFLSAPRIPPVHRRPSNWLTLNPIYLKLELTLNLIYPELNLNVLWTWFTLPLIYLELRVASGWELFQRCSVQCRHRLQHREDQRFRFSAIHSTSMHSLSHRNEHCI